MCIRVLKIGNENDPQLAISIKKSVSIDQKWWLKKTKFEEQYA